MGRPLGWILMAVVGIACSKAATDGRPASTAARRAAPILTDVDSRNLAARVESFRGNKAVLVNIWATWCAPCVKEFPDLVKLHRDHSDRVHVLFVSADFEDQRSVVQSFLEKQGVDWETFFKAENDQDFIPAVWPEWSGALPATLLYDKKGRIVKFWEGAPEWAEIESAVGNVAGF